MKVQYMGTAAAEAIPALFCQCPVCEHARKVLGHEYRGRSGAVLNDKVMIDFPPDIYATTLRVGVYLPGITHLFFTHSHEDHCDPSELLNRAQPVTCKRLPGCEEPLQIYGNRQVLERLKRCEGRTGLELHYIAPFETVQAGSISVTPLLGQHIVNEDCYLYLAEENGRRFLYAHDTGMFPEETMAYLKGRRLDAISFDCTNVMLNGRRGHMGLEADDELKKMLIEQGSADEKTYCIVHHFSHNGFIPEGRLYTLEEFEKNAADRGFDVSYDGMTFEV